MLLQVKRYYELLKENVDKKDIAAVKQLCEQPETYIDTVFGNLNKPKIEFIPEKSDGAFGIKKLEQQNSITQEF